MNQVIEASLREHCQKQGLTSHAPLALWILAKSPLVFGFLAET